MTDLSKFSIEELEHKKLAAQRLLAARKARDSLIDFTRFTMPDPNDPDNMGASLYSVQSLHRVIAEALEKAESGQMLAEGKRILLISVGPQRGKTELVSRRFPAWIMGRRPQRNLIFATYNDTFANETGDDVRSIMSSRQYAQVFPMTRLRMGSKARDHQVTEQGGKMSFVGRGGTAAGRPADIVLIDDPLKNAEEANSLTIRDACWFWFTRVMTSRCHAYSVMVIISCMTGDTPVLMETGRNKPLRNIRKGDRVATYENGKVTVSTVRNWINNGPDTVYEIRMKSGTIVKANARHPFLVEDDGETKWRRTATLKKGNIILRAIGANGKELYAPRKLVQGRQNAWACACRTTTRIAGKLAFVRLPLILYRGAKQGCAIAMESVMPIMNVFSMNKMDCVQSANNLHHTETHALIGQTNYASITATKQKQSGVFSVTIATLQSVMGRAKQFFSPPLSTYEITEDTVIDVVRVGVEDVFDIEIEKTGNFIANGLISHNTRWHEDDLIGRLTDRTSAYYDEEMAKSVFYINLPAYVEDKALAKALDIPVGGSLWEERFPLAMLKLRQRVDPQGFSALEMGRPTPPEGAFYKSAHIRSCGYKSMDKLPKSLQHYGSCDLAVSDERTADSSVILDWGLDEHDVLWLLPDIYWEKKKADIVVEQLMKMGKNRWMTLFGEKGQIDRAIRPFLEKRMQEEGVYFSIETFPNVNKGQASLSFRGRLAQGKVRFPVFVQWWPKAEEQMLKFTGSGDDKEDDFCDALARVGQGLQMQVTASKYRDKTDNVIPMAGTVAWMYRQYTHRKTEEKRRQSVRGM